MTLLTGEQLRIGDGRGWHFVNGPWLDGEGGALTMPDDTRALTGSGLERHHYAFHTAAGYRDVRVRFEFRLMSHSDAGIVFRGRDESHFYLLHFPNGGQASRAQHFWAAFSRMDESGYLRILKMEMVSRVPSNSGLWLGADVTLAGGTVRARIGEHGVFEASDDTYAGPGAIGVHLFGDASLRNVVVEGGPEPFQWDSRPRQPTNWFFPCPDTKHGLWQRPRELVWLRDPPGGVGGGEELLLNYTVQEKPYTGTITPLLARSRDRGRTWSQPEPLPAWRPGGGGDKAIQPRLHVTPGGTLIALLQTQREGLYRAESADRGRTWSEPVLAAPGTPPPAGLERFSHFGTPQHPLNLDDGAMLLFGIGIHSLQQSGLTILTWGSLHNQAFASRSTDDGRSWSAPVNVDNPGIQHEGKPIPGNLDLTEVAAAQLPDGRILGLIRPIYSPWMWETWSHDRGKTWGPCVLGPFPGYATSNMLRTSNGALLLGHRVPGVTVHTSRDDGHTWDRGTYIDSGIWGLGAMTEVEPGVVLYVYWDTAMSFMRGQFFRVTDEGLQPVRR